MRKWKNAYIQILTTEIREGQKQGNPRIVWPETNEPRQTKTTTHRGNMFLKDIEWDIQSETHVSHHAMQTYIEEHFARMREKWEVGRIQPEAWANNTQMERYADEQRSFRIKHSSSKAQQYSQNWRTEQKINGLGKGTDGHEFAREIQKLSNRKSVGYDDLTAEVFKINSTWLIPIIKQMCNIIAHRKAMPKWWQRGLMTFLRRKMRATT